MPDHACRKTGPHPCATGEHRKQKELQGTNPVLDAVDAGHYSQDCSDKPGTGRTLRCREDGELWPCPTVVTARKAATHRANA